MDSKKRYPVYLYPLVFLGLFVLMNSMMSGPEVTEISYQDFLELVETDKVAVIVLGAEEITGEKVMADGSKPPEAETLRLSTKKAPWASWLGMDKKTRPASDFFHTKRFPDPTLVDRLHTKNVDFRSKIESDFLSSLLVNLLPLVLLIALFWGTGIGKMMRGPNSLSVGKNRSKIYEEDPANRVGFSDVAGVDEAIEEVREVVDFLREPERFTKLGARLPKGVLLIGPPGTGKTLLARAVAGEAKVPFFKMSGSDFVEMFVGVGASRVRDLFDQAKAKSPCIIFIDELEAIGRSRTSGNGPMMGNSEQENTLNQLLVEMDGFDGTKSVILLAATNRPEVLDPALLRPGRFDRQVLVDRPHRDGRRAILEVHSKPIKMAENVDLDGIANRTPGFVGADLANLCNEAALFASRRMGESVDTIDFDNAIERIVGGLEKKGQVIRPSERRRIAYHEAGHALIAHRTPGADPVQKISIVPRGAGALGYTMQAPDQERFLYRSEELLSEVCVLLGGRAAEQIIFGDISTGAANDLERANDMLRRYLWVYGMGENSRNLSLIEPGARGYLGGARQLTQHSPELLASLEKEHNKLLERCYEQALAMLETERDNLIKISEQLLSEEKIDANGIIEILGPSATKLDDAALAAQEEAQSEQDNLEAKAGEDEMAPEPSV